MLLNNKVGIKRPCCFKSRSTVSKKFAQDSSVKSVSPLVTRASLVAQMAKNLPAMQETVFYPCVRKISWRRKRQPTPVFLCEEFHGQGNLAGYSPWGCEESDMTE